MDKKKVTGTIMLSGNNGKKSFLVHQSNNNYNFLDEFIQPDMTNMAAILKAFQKQAGIDINLIDLVELVSIKVDGVRTPLFVFEMTEANHEVVVSSVGSEFSWQNSETLSSMLKDLELSEVPVFECEK